MIQLNELLEAENELYCKVMAGNNRWEQAFNVDKLYQPVIFSMDKLLESPSAMKYYSLFVKDATERIKQGMF
jgi:hypothetical protein